MLSPKTKDFLRRWSRIFFILFWDFVLFLIATNIQAGWLYVVIALFIMLAIIAAVYPKLMLKDLSVGMTLQDYTERNSSSTAVLYITNNGSRVKYAVRVQPEGGGGFDFDPGAVLFVEIPPGETVSASFKYICGRRGRIGPDILSLTCGVPIGIYYAKRILPCGAFSLVYPAISKISAAEQAREFSMYDPGPLQKNLALQDPYHYNLREYTPGDSLRSMHWKMTARLGEPVIRVFERKIFGQASIVVDNDRANWPAGTEDAFEEMLERALSAAKHLLFVAGYTVTITGTAAPGVIIENEAAWERALHWFAMLELGEPLYEKAQSAIGEDSDIGLHFSAQGVKRTEKART